MTVRYVRTLSPLAVRGIVKSGLRAGMRPWLALEPFDMSDGSFKVLCESEGWRWDESSPLVDKWVRP